MTERIFVAQSVPSVADRLGQDITDLPFLQHLAQVMPAADVAFGGWRGDRNTPSPAAVPFTLWPSRHSLEPLDRLNMIG